jgi:hypothetical protein
MLGYDVIQIVLASVIPITLGAIIYNPIKRRRDMFKITIKM